MADCSAAACAWARGAPGRRRRAGAHRERHHSRESARITITNMENTQTWVFFGGRWKIIGARGEASFIAGLASLMLLAGFLSGILLMTRLYEERSGLTKSAWRQSSGPSLG